MEYFFSDFTQKGYTLLFKIVLACYIIFGALILRSKRENSQSYFRQDRNLLLSFVFFMIFFAGTRSIRIGTDTINYYRFYFLKGIYLQDPIEFFGYFQTDLLFEVLMFITFPFKNFTLFLLVLAIILNVGLYFFVRRFSDYGKDGSSLILFLTFASAFSFLQLEVNIIRNGLSITFILLALDCLLKEKLKPAIFLFVIAYFFHGTSLIPISAILLSRLLKNVEIKYFIVLFIMAIGLSFIGFGFHSIPFLQNISGEDFKRLVFTGETTYRIGFRLDFVLYNAFFLFLFVKFSNLKNTKDLFLIKYFVITSVIFFFNFNIPFSDRIGLYSWIAIPLLLFNTIKNSYKEKSLYLSSLGALLYFIINHVILFP